MLFQVGGQGTRPTFFEMAAAQQLPLYEDPSSTGFWTTRMSSSPCSCSSSKLIAYELQARFRNSDSSVLLSLCSGIDFVFWVLFVFSADASFCESLYGLRRRAVKIKARLNPADEIQHSGLKKRQRLLSVVFLVVLPYFKSKLYSIYNRERET
ncbi:hypothetical protein ACFX13_010812 [Malus domestica]